jgi:hypothetical protein
MILKSKLLLVCLLVSSCSNIDKTQLKLFESQTSRETPSDTLSSPREFHGETIVISNGSEVVSQTATTYFLEHPRRSRGMPQVAAPYRGDSNRLSIDETKQLYGEPDYIDESGRWHYWGSDGGKLLQVRR